MSAMVYRLLVPVRLSGTPSQQRRTTLSRLSSTSIPTLNQTQPAKNSRPVLFQARVALRPHPPPTKMRTAGSVEDLARNTGSHALSLRRLLRALAAYGVFSEAADDHFALGPLGA